MADEQQNDTQQQDNDDSRDWKAEAKKMSDEIRTFHKERDDLKRRAKDLEGRVMSDEQAERYKQLEAAAEKAEEERKRKAGEFDQWRDQIAKKHQTELQDREQKFSTLSRKFQQTVIRAEFGSASDYFGAHDQSQTILDVELGMAALGKYVTVEDADDDPRGYRIVVRTPTGQTILGKDGNPAPFTDAIGELIATLPNKDRILRGSGKAGSGNTGGATGVNGALDLNRLTPSDFQDPKVRAALKQRQAAAGGLVFGSAWDRART